MQDDTQDTQSSPDGTVASTNDDGLTFDALIVSNSPTSASPDAAFPGPSQPAAEEQGLALPQKRPISASESDTGARIIWVLLFLIALMLMRYAVPFAVEEISRAVTRGRQRAEYEVATEYLNKVSFDSVSKAYQMVNHRVAPSVVHINARHSAAPAPRDEQAFMFGGRRPQQDQGSGVIIDPLGHIVTNRHVVLSGEDIRVTLSDGRQASAEIIGTDALTDLAVIRIPTEHLIPADWGDSNQLEVGALVWAAGSPFGLQSTVTAGILSAKNRAGFAGTPYQDFLQTDAAVNPGNSGGPLVNGAGEVIGINTAIIGESYQGISFAVPSSVARNVCDRLIQSGHVDRGYLGVEMAEISEELQIQYQLTTDEGALVVSVVPGTPADRAGIEELDVIIRWNGEDVASPTDVSRVVARTPIGSKAAVTVLREGRPLVLQAAIGRRRER